jgi:predicted transcriptional regulator
VADFLETPAGLTLYPHDGQAKQTARDLQERVDDAGGDPELHECFRSPTEEVSQTLQDAQNHFPTLGAGAARLWKDGGLDIPNLRHRLATWLETELGIEVRSVAFHAGDRRVRSYDPERPSLERSEVLAPRSVNFQFAHMIGLLSHRPAFDGILGCDLRHGKELVYRDGIDLDTPTPVTVGVSCRLCERLDRAERACPAVDRPMHFDENVRGLSFYAPVEQ